MAPRNRRSTGEAADLLQPLPQSWAEVVDLVRQLRPDLDAGALAERLRQRIHWELFCNGPIGRRAERLERSAEAELARVLTRYPALLGRLKPEYREPAQRPSDSDRWLPARPGRAVAFICALAWSELGGRVTTSHAEQLKAPAPWHCFVRAVFEAFRLAHADKRGQEAARHFVRFRRQN
jgi:hypothetical protein